MEKRAIVIWAVIIIVFVAFLGWWFFSHTNRVISKHGNVQTQGKTSEKSITAFTFSGLGSGVSQVVDSANHTVTLVVPNGTDVTKLTPDISVSGSATISPDSGVVQDFTKPIVYTITAQDGSTQDYTVTVKVATAKGFGGS